jgi:hypothetical protein
MKLLLTILSITFTFSSLAVERSVTLNLSSLYDQFDAGLYHINTKISHKKTPSHSILTKRIKEDDGYWYCTTSAKFEVGEMTTVMIHDENNWKTSLNQKIYATISKTVEGKDCSHRLEDFSSTQKLYIRTSLEKPIQLPVIPPYDYKFVQAYITPFNGYLYSIAEIKLIDGVLVLNPSQLLSDESIAFYNNRNAFSLYYYVTAVKVMTTLSLGTDVVAFE